jgi:hypothetical protein
MIKSNVLYIEQNKPTRLCRISEKNKHDYVYSDQNRSQFFWFSAYTWLTCAICGKYQLKWKGRRSLPVWSLNKNWRKMRTMYSFATMEYNERRKRYGNIHITDMDMGHNSITSKFIRNNYSDMCNVILYRILEHQTTNRVCDVCFWGVHI